MFALKSGRNWPPQLKHKNTAVTGGVLWIIKMKN